MKPSLLSKQELESLPINLPEWDYLEKKLIREFKFTNFIEAFAFMTKVAIIAEGMNHHPEWSNVYAQVKVQLTTHDLGGVSNLDFDLAKQINKLIT